MYLSDSHVSTIPSTLLFFACVAMAAYPVVLGILRIVANLRLASMQPPDARSGFLKPGPAVIKGRVRKHDDQSMRVEITQAGREWRIKHGWMHEWKEVERKVTAGVFHVILDDGKRIEIVAGDDTFLVDQIDAGKIIGEKRRVRTAELSDNEPVFVVGELALGASTPSAITTTFREAANVGYRMVAPRGGQLLISSEPLSQRYRNRAKAHAKKLLLSSALFVASQVCVSGFYASVLLGQRDELVVKDMRTFVTRNRRSSTTHYRLTGVIASSGIAKYEDASSRTYHAVKPGDRIPIRVMRSANHENLLHLGKTPTLNVVAALFGLGIATAGLLTWLEWRKRSRPWYAQRPLVEQAQGRL